MKSILILLLPIVIVGCQTAPVHPLPIPAPEVATQPVLAPTVSSSTADLTALERRIRQQSQLIDALVSQNDALAARTGNVPETLPATPSVAGNPAPAGKAPAPAAAATPTKEIPTTSFLTPNSEGVIDLVAPPAEAVDTSTNPFAVRSVPPGSIREISIHVAGIIAGAVACAVVNDRLVQAGDSIEVLPVERIEPNAVILRHGLRQLRLPVSSRPVRVRLSL